MYRIPLVLIALVVIVTALAGQIIWGDGIVWDTLDGDQILWGTLGGDGDSIVWGT